MTTTSRIQWAALGMWVAISFATGIASPSFAQPAPPQTIELPAYALRAGQMVDVGGYKLNLYCFGQGTPTIVMLSGGAWGAVAWAKIQPQLAKSTRVCSYDRAGMNFSEVGPVERRVDQDVTDLHALLKRAEIPAPYVLVGWSAGGMLSRWYANLHPDDVAGIVTVDGSDFDYWDSSTETTWLKAAVQAFRACREAASSGAFDSDPASFERCRAYGNPLPFFPELRKTLEPTLRNPALWAQWLHDLEQIDARAQAQRSTRRAYGSMPLRVLVAGYHFGDPQQGARMPDKPADAAFVDHSYRIAGLSTAGQLLVFPRTSHAIHFDRPADVIRAIEGVLNEARAAPHKALEPGT